MTISLQIAYSTENGTTFNYEYYMENHMELIGRVMGLHRGGMYKLLKSCPVDRILQHLSMQ